MGTDPEYERKQKDIEGRNRWGRRENSDEIVKENNREGNHFFQEELSD